MSELGQNQMLTHDGRTRREWVWTFATWPDDDLCGLADAVDRLLFDLGCIGPDG